MSMTRYALVQLRLPEIFGPEISELAGDIMLGQSTDRTFERAMELQLYRKTVEAEAADLEHLFETCQRDLNATFAGPRSLSVGDIVVDAAGGAAWYCAPVGWQPLEAPRLSAVLQLL